MTMASLFAERVKMLTFQKLRTKVRQFGLESRQNLTAFVAPQHRTLHEDDAAIVEALHQEGVYVTSIERLFQNENDPFTESIKRAADDLAIDTDLAAPCYLQRMAASVDMLPDYLIANHSKVFCLGLSRRLLDLVENYLGLSAAYHGVALRRSLIDGKESGPRLWHLDGEDFRVVRVLIYLNDVMADGGPFEYIPRSYGLTYKHLKGLDALITESEMLKIVPENVFRQVYGKAGTVILCDTANTFHHEKLQTSQARSVAMYGFSSRVPKDKALAERHFPSGVLRESLMPLLSFSQIPYVFAWR